MCKSLGTAGVQHNYHCPLYFSHKDSAELIGRLIWRFIDFNTIGSPRTEDVCEKLSTLGLVNQEDLRDKRRVFDNL